MTAIFLLLLSQLSVSAAVMCDEGAGLRTLEMFATSCCAPAGPQDGCDAPTTETSENDCGGCTDTTLAGSNLLGGRVGDSPHSEILSEPTVVEHIFHAAPSTASPVKALSTTVVPSFTTLALYASCVVFRC
jgi:hypothetical protein